VSNLNFKSNITIHKGSLIASLEAINSEDYAILRHDSRPFTQKDNIPILSIDLDAYSYSGMISPEAPVHLTTAAMATSALSEGDDDPPIPQRSQEEITAALAAISIEGTPELTAKMREIVARHPQLFSLTGITRHMNNGTSAHIEVNADPEVAKYSRWSVAATQHGEQLLLQHLQHGIVEWAPADDARYRHAVFLKKKSNGKFRLLSDLRALNKVINLDRYPLSSVQQSLDAVSGSQHFAAVDIVDAYYSVKLDRASRKYLTFATPWGLMRYRVLAQGLATAPAIFTRAIHNTLGDTLWRSAIPYLDDILIHAKTEDGFLEALEEVFSRLDEDGWTLAANKCQINLARLNYLGFIITKDSVEPDDRKIAAIINYPTPNNGEELRRFVYMAAFFRSFVWKFADIVKPLQDLINDYFLRDIWRWTDIEQRALHSLKCHLTSPGPLAHPDMSLPFNVYADTSRVGTGAILTQVQNGREVVISYWSRTLTAPQRLWAVTEIELLGVVTCVLNAFRPYLHGQRITLFIDHISLKWLDTLGLMVRVTEGYWVWRSNSKGTPLTLSTRVARPSSSWTRPLERHCL
jgi:hypothetical protein